MGERIGVFVCTCGPNIGDSIDTDAIITAVKSRKGVVTAKSHNLLCTEDGRAFLTNEIKTEQLTRVVIAACTPKQYEHLFMKVCEEAGVNSYLLAMANIREQCAWVTPDPAAATEKAKSLCLAALNRVTLQEPIEKREIEMQPDVLVVGGGVAGLEACVSLAQKGRRRVYLVEKSPCIGGITCRFEKVYPTLECAPCMVTPELQEVLQSDTIETFTCTEIEEVLGSLGNFTVKLRKKARYVNEEACIGCNACCEPCPVTVPNEFDAGLSERKAIYLPFAGALPNVPVIDGDTCLRLNGAECTACEACCSFGAIDFSDTDTIVEKKVSAIVVAVGASLGGPRGLPHYGYGTFDNVLTSLQVERLNASNGPTGGKIRLKNGKEPESIAFVQCVGRKENGYCSGICCMYSLALALLIAEKLPGVTIYDFYRDLCLPKLGHQKLYDAAVSKGVEFIRSSEQTRVVTEGEHLRVEFETESAEKKSVSVDMVVLAPAVVPAEDTEKLAALLAIPLDEHGFFSGAHILMRPVATAREGVFIAGACQGPKDIQESVAQGSAAAGKILSRLIPGEKLELEANVATIDEAVCCSCYICLSLCSYAAIARDTTKKTPVVDATLCKGCGTCVAACPTGACRAVHFTGDQIRSELTGVLK